ncbi:hypothetical protein ACEWY4_013247 [Coilia grayii]|uniref:TOG domain-containing protein n=1 Tax=Coilia grayii TaxID=363190 RepID=A0ABD1JVS4_9TELE
MDFSRLKEGLSKLLAVKRKSGGSILQPMPRVLPPIGSAPQQQQQQSGLMEAASSSSPLPAAVDPALLELFLGDRVPSGTLRAGAPRPLGRKNLTGLDHAHPLQPLFHGRASRNAADGSSSSSMAPAPPAVAKATGEGATKPLKARRCGKALHGVSLKPSGRPDDKNSCRADVMLDQEKDRDAMLKSLNIMQKMKEWLRQESIRVAEEMRLTNIDLNSCVMVADHSGSFAGNLRTPLEQSALPSVGASTVPTVPTVPAPPQALSTNNGQFRSRVPRFKKTSAVSVATAVEEPKSVESVAVRRQEGRKVEEVKEMKKTVREVKQTKERERQQAKKVPQPARRSPVPHPEQTLLQAFRLLSTDDWEKKVEGLNSIRRLCTHHTEVLLPRLHDLCLAVTKEVKNLRSVVSRVAMLTLAHLFTNLGQGMDPEVEGTAQVLLQKAGEANSFLREDAEMALSHMVLCVSPSRSMAALINTGLKHRCAAVRSSAAQHLGVLAEAVGSSRLLSGRKELTDRFVHAISCFALDSAQEVRWTHARDTLALLASHPDIIKMVEKFAPKRDQNSIKDIINKCQCR